MNYSDTIEYLFSRLPMYQRKGIAAYKKNIGNIIKACAYLKNPHKKFKSIHIAGTNGKGSTSHIIASIIQEAGYNCGLYTSPHLKDFKERIRYNGKKISKNDVVDFVERNKNNFEMLNMSFFEYTVAMAFDFFQKKKVDIAIIETGLGGRLDSTNIILPEVSVITNISMDHSNLLGDSLKKIAIEKAGIIKPNTPVVIGKKQDSINTIFQKIAKNLNSNIFYATELNNNNNLYNIKNAPDYHIENIKTAIATIKILNWNINNEHIQNGIINVNKNTDLKGRWQKLSNNPITICDTAHNEEGIKNICDEIKKIKFNKLHFILGTVNDKNLDKILCLLPKTAKYYFCKPNIERGLNASLLKQEAIKHGLKGEDFQSTKLAFRIANKNAKPNDMIFIGGSNFVVAEII